MQYWEEQCPLATSIYIFVNVNVAGFLFHEQQGNGSGVSDPHISRCVCVYCEATMEKRMQTHTHTHIHTHTNGN